MFVPLRDAERLAAATEIEAGRNESARRRLRKLATDQAGLPISATLHRMAIQLAAADQADDYESLLREHLDKWPESRHYQQVLFWLANLGAASG